MSEQEGEQEGEQGAPPEWRMGSVSVFQAGAAAQSPLYQIGYQWHRIHLSRLLLKPKGVHRRQFRPGTASKSRQENGVPI